MEILIINFGNTNFNYVFFMRENHHRSTRKKKILKGQNDLKRWPAIFLLMDFVFMLFISHKIFLYDVHLSILISIQIKCYHKHNLLYFVSSQLQNGHFFLFLFNYSVKLACLNIGTHYSVGWGFLWDVFL